MNVLLTGIKPTGSPHLGNLIGMISPTIKLLPDFYSYVFIADVHALNSVKDGFLIRQWSNEIAATFLALGLDPEQAIFFRQSDVVEALALAMLLMNVTPKSMMNRAHAYKQASDPRNIGKESDTNINMGLYTYPVLMAADILLYQADRVPVGIDQMQHLEFAKLIAKSFNNAYKQRVFTTPEPILQSSGLLVGTDGRKKMSKSYNNTIPIFSDPDHLWSLIKKIPTDSKRPDEPKDPDMSVLYSLYKAFADPSDSGIMRDKFISGGIGYLEVKEILFDLISQLLREPKVRYDDLISNPDYLDRILQIGSEKARIAANKTLSIVTKAMLG